MAKATLPTNYKDDILNSSMNGKRRYQEIPNSDGTISLEDKTTYDQTGTNFGASQVNEMNRNINESADAGRIIDSLSSIMTNTQQKYIAGALALKEVNNSLNGVSFKVDPQTGKITGYTTKTGGADSVFPFSDITEEQIINTIGRIDYGTITGSPFDTVAYTATTDMLCLISSYVYSYSGGATLQNTDISVYNSSGVLRQYIGGNGRSDEIRMKLNKGDYIKFKGNTVSHIGSIKVDISITYVPLQ